jgi:hypothetical protein
MANEAFGLAEVGDWRQRRRHSAGKWGLAALGCVGAAVLAFVADMIRPSLVGLVVDVLFALALALFICVVMALVRLIQSVPERSAPLSLSNELAPPRPRRLGNRDPSLEMVFPRAHPPADAETVPSMVLRPSSAISANRWVRNLSLPAVGALCVVVIYRLRTIPGTGAGLLIGLMGLALVAVFFFRRAEIVIDGRTIAYRRFLFTRRFPLTQVGGLAIRPLSLAFNYYAAKAPPYAVVYSRDGRGLFSFSAALWPDADLARLQGAIGGESSDWPVGAADLVKEFPGALAWWVVFMDSHPIWTLVLGTPLMFLAVVLGLAAWYLFTGR